MITKIPYTTKNSPGKIYLFFAVFILSSANPVIRKLTKIGSQHLIDGQNPISFTNVLFVGNIFGLIVLTLIYRRQLNFNSIKQLALPDYLSIIVVALLSGVIAPGATFQALSHTTVTNVILIGRIEPPIFLGLSVWLLGEKINAWKIAGAIVSFAGVMTTVFLQSIWEDLTSPEVFSTVGIGEIFAGIAAVALAVSCIISKTRLARIPIGVYMVFRTTLSTLIFLFAVLSIRGTNHFTESIFSPFLWQWMLIYGAIIIGFGQTFWFKGLKKSSNSMVAIARAFNPIAGIFAAYVILRETPTSAQLIGGSIILVGIVLSYFGNWSQTLNTANFNKNIQILPMHDQKYY